MITNALNHGLSEQELRIILTTVQTYQTEIAEVKIFGSRANGNYKPYSDIDLVIYGNIKQLQIDDLNTLFDESNLGVSVDIKGYNQVKYPPLKTHIDSDAKTLFSQKQIAQKPDQ